MHFHFSKRRWAGWTPVYLLLASAALFCAGCGRKTPEPKLTRLTIAFPKLVGYGLFYLAQDKGFFKEEGLELVFIDEQLDSARRDAFQAGILDCEAGTMELLVSKAAQSTPIVAVLELDSSANRNWCAS
jgi:NitT/TauT family transport system substrate-binding protein